MKSLGLLLLVSPLLLAGKCIDYDPAFDAQAADHDGHGDSDSVIPAVPCANTEEAQLRVEEFQFPILCGCAEEPWANTDSPSNTCTVARGTTVVWRFAGSEDHNVTSLAATFGGSPDQIAGRFEHTFDEPGTFDYHCTLHSEMTGYAIVVK